MNAALTDAQIATARGALFEMQRFAGGELADDAKFELSLPFTIYTVSLDDLSHATWSDLVTSAAIRLLAVSSQCAVTIDIQAGNGGQVLQASIGQLADRMLQSLQEIAGDIDPSLSVLQVAGIRAEALWNRDTGRLRALIGPRNKDFIGWCLSQRDGRGVGQK